MKAASLLSSMSPLAPTSCRSSSEWMNYKRVGKCTSSRRKMSLARLDCLREYSIDLPNPNCRLLPKYVQLRASCIYCVRLTNIIWRRANRETWRQTKHSTLANQNEIAREGHCARFLLSFLTQRPDKIYCRRRRRRPNWRTRRRR